MSNNNENSNIEETDAIRELLINLLSILNEFIKATNVDGDSLSISTPILVEVAESVFRDIEHHKSFHNIAHVSASYELSLICYYVLKYRPIYIPKDGVVKNPNEKFCVYLLLTQKSESSKPNEEFEEFCMYMFKYGDITKDSLYLLFNTVASLTKGGSSV